MRNLLLTRTYNTLLLRDALAQRALPLVDAVAEAILARRLDDPARQEYATALISGMMTLSEFIERLMRQHEARKRFDQDIIREFVQGAYAATVKRPPSETELRRAAERVSETGAVEGFLNDLYSLPQAKHNLFVSALGDGGVADLILIHLKNQSQREEK
ncbi:hypothetical protein [Caulobacter sp. S45]|uniref:hypothetical protein n=1 Tax=Caulobacter sp. S45 TaxID=1641861 RepID=UPI00131C7115|nr:hypothetical protein [Caulobacter sp. S45]